MKTTFSSGVVVTSKWLNGAKEIFFDGQDLDWHYNPLGLNSLITVGPNGLDTRYMTLGTNQPNLSTLGEFISGTPISGTKVVTGLWWFGFPEIPGIGGNVNPRNIPNNAPLSYTTNAKYFYANGVNDPSIDQKYAGLVDVDLVTKLILTEQLDNLVVDNGEY